MTQRLHVGVVGAGVNWRKRYRAALLAARDRFHIRAVGDDVYQRAATEARRLDCDPAEGILDLLETPGLDAVLLLERPWSGLWAVEQACRLNKPVFCVPAPDADDLSTVGWDQGQVMWELKLRCTPATIRLRRLLRSRLGRPRLVTAQLASAGASADPLQEEGLFELVDWCLHVMDGAPQHVHVQRTPPAEQSLASILLEFEDQRAAQMLITCCSTLAEARQTEARVIAENGLAIIRQPNRITWRYPGGTSQERLSMTWPTEYRRLRHFHRFVTSGRPAPLDISPALTVLEAVRSV